MEVERTSIFFAFYASSGPLAFVAWAFQCFQWLILFSFIDWEFSSRDRGVAGLRAHSSLCIWPDSLVVESVLLLLLHSSALAFCTSLPFIPLKASCLSSRYYESINSLPQLPLQISIFNFSKLNRCLILRRCNKPFTNPNKIWNCLAPK